MDDEATSIASAIHLYGPESIALSAVVGGRIPIPGRCPGLS
jgi:hypothetical protein